LPQPPGPVSVRRRLLPSNLRTSATSSCRPTKLESSRGRLLGGRPGARATASASGDSKARSLWGFWGGGGRGSIPSSLTLGGAIAFSCSWPTVYPSCQSAWATHCAKPALRVRLPSAYRPADHARHRCPNRGNRERRPSPLHRSVTRILRPLTRFDPQRCRGRIQRDVWNEKRWAVPARIYRTTGPVPVRPRRSDG
jgi:hypothetical protein